MCAFVVFGFCFSIPSQEIGLGNVSEMTNFVCRVGRITLTQLINELYIHSQYMRVVKSVVRSVPLPVVWEVGKRWFCPGQHKSVACQALALAQTLALHDGLCQSWEVGQCQYTTVICCDSIRFHKVKRRTRIVLFLALSRRR